MSIYLTFSFGIARQKYLPLLLDGEVIRPFSPERYVDQCKAVVGWGKKANTDKARQFAQRYHLPYWSLEDGFLRSLNPGSQGDTSISFIVDPVGIYYDATQPSRLENWLNDPAFTPTDEEIRLAKEAIAFIKEYHISKYNAAPDFDPKIFANNPKKKVLVIDQTAGDLSLRYGQVQPNTFSNMLAAAKKENPDAEIIIKLHPENLQGRKNNHLEGIDLKGFTVLTEDYNPISLLRYVDQVYVMSSQVGFEALLVEKPVRCFGMPFYAGWGLTQDELINDRRQQTRSLIDIFVAAYLRYTRYVDPNTQQPCSIIDALQHLQRARHFNELNRGTFFCFGFQRWKRPYVKPFLRNKTNTIHFVKSMKQAIAKGYNEQSKILVWGMNQPDELKNKRVGCIEDGFIRSVGLGSDLIRPMSLVVDMQGIYFDPQQPSDLESILNDTTFSTTLLERAKKLRQLLLKSKISKYNTQKHHPLNVPHDKKIILVPGQVEDDASIIRGAGKINTNLALLKEVRRQRPDSYILYKPHPDVLSGNRKAVTSLADALTYCDKIITEHSVASCLPVANEVHTMTSLVGFEALLRELPVYTYGMPFYAAWGLTHDTMPCERRKRQLTLDELVAGTLMLYPRYFNWENNEWCEPETIIQHLETNYAKMPAYLLNPNYFVRLGRKLLALIRNYAH